MDNLRARAAKLLRGSHPLARVSDGTCPVNLLSRFVAGESLDAPDVREQLSAGVRRALARAAGPTEPPGPARDAQAFYSTAAEILQAIAAAVSAGHAEPLYDPLCLNKNTADDHA
jgi:hypothetical protein